MESTFQSKLSTLLGLQFHQERLLGVKNTLVMWMPSGKAVFHLDCLPRKTRTRFITISDLSILFCDATIYHKSVLSACTLKKYFHNSVTIFSSIVDLSISYVLRNALCYSRLQNCFIYLQTEVNNINRPFLEMFHWHYANLTKCFIVEWYCNFIQFCGITTASVKKK